MLVCQNIVVEYKCPWKHRDRPAKEAFLTPEIGGTVTEEGFTLKKNASYYYIVQLQMFVCGLSWSDFVVWTEKGIFVAAVPFGEEFVASLFKGVESFWYGQILPVVINELTNTDPVILKATGKSFCFVS